MLHIVSVHTLSALCPAITGTIAMTDNVTGQDLLALTTASAETGSNAESEHLTKQHCDSKRRIRFHTLVDKQCVHFVKVTGKKSKSSNCKRLFKTLEAC